MFERVCDPAAAAHLFAGWDETPVWSCLQGVMGAVYADCARTPTRAAAALGDFCFFAGDADADFVGRALAAAARPACIAVPRDDAWAACIEAHYGERARRFERYAFAKDPAAFNENHLRALAARIPAGYVLLPVDAELYGQCLREEWGRDLVSQYPTYEHYRELGLGVAAVCDGRLAAGASSYSTYRGGIEIEVDTHPDHRRRGLARACAAQLVLDCRERGLYPSWDAHTSSSADLARQLGYVFSHAYVAYEVAGDEAGGAYITNRPN